MRFWPQRAFTVFELLVIISVISILALLMTISFGSWQQAQAKHSVLSDMRQATSGLQSYKNFKSNYPPNMAGTNFASSPQVALMLRTNAPSVGVYQNLNGGQNAQLFLNTCNANMFVTPNNTTCSFEGNGNGAKIHVKGTTGSNAIWNSPINQGDLSLSCGSQQTSCNQALSTIISEFLSQGGEFPIIVPGSNVTLPEPTLMPNGPADRYCLEGRASNYSTIVYHVLSEDDLIVAGQCPNDPTLHYFQSV